MTDQGGSGPRHQSTPVRPPSAEAGQHAGPSFLPPPPPPAPPPAGPGGHWYGVPPGDAPPTAHQMPPGGDPHFVPAGSHPLPADRRPGRARNVAIAVLVVVALFAGLVIWLGSSADPGPEDPPATAAPPGVDPEPTEPTGPEPTEPGSTGSEPRPTDEDTGPGEPPPPEYDPVRPAPDLPAEQAGHLGTVVDIRTGQLRYQEVELFGLYLYQCLFSMTYENLTDVPREVTMGFRIPGVEEPRWQSSRPETMEPGDVRRLVLGWEDESASGLGLTPEQCRGNVELFLLEVAPG